MSEYIVDLVTSEDISAPDELVCGDYEADEIKIATAGDYTRGMVLIYDSGEYKKPAAAAGITGAAEVCILCDDVTVPASDYVIRSGYFKGRFNGNAVILAYEQASDDHDTLIDAIRQKLRLQGIYIV